MLLAASWRAAGRADDFAAARGFGGANEGADEFAVDERCDFFDIEAGRSKKIAGFIDFVNASGLDVHGFEAGSIKFISVFVLLEGAGDAAYPEFHALANGSGDFTANNDIGDGETAAGFQHAEGFAEDATLVAGKIDDAVGDDDVDGVVRQRNVFNGAFQKFDVFDAGFFLVLAGEGEHFVGHVQAVGFAGRADAFCGKDDIDAAAGTEIEDDFAGLKLREGGWIAAAERGSDGFFRELGFFVVVVEIFRDGVAATEFGAAATRRAAAGSALGGFDVFLFHGFLDVWLTHGSSSL